MLGREKLRSLTALEIDVRHLACLPTLEAATWIVESQAHYSLPPTSCGLACLSKGKPL